MRSVQIDSLGGHRLPTGWNVTIIGDLFQIQQGKALSAPARTANERFPFLRTSNVLWGALDLGHIDSMGMSDAERARLDLQEGDLLVCEGGEIGRCAVWRGELEQCYFQNHIHRLRPRDERVDTQFYVYWLQLAFTRLGVYSGAGTKTTIENLSGGRLAALKVPVPPMTEQIRVVRVMRSIQAAAVAGASCADATAVLERSLLASIFPRTIEDAPSSILGRRTNWHKCSVGDQVALQRGFDITKRQQRPGAIPVISSSGTKSFHDTPMAKGPGVVIGRKGSLGTAHYVTTDYWPHDTTLWVTDFKGNDPRFVYYFFRQLDVSHLDVGGSNPTLNRNHLYPEAVVWPDLDTQHRVVRACDVLQVRERAARDNVRAIDRLFYSALHEAFSDRGDLS